MKNRHRILLSLLAGSLGVLATRSIRRQMELSLTVSQEQAIFAGEEMLNDGSNILAVTAHPDDLEIFMGGTLKLLTSRGCKVTVIDVSDREQGPQLPDQAELREAQQQEASELPDTNEPVFLHLPDLKLSQEANQVPLLRREVERINPDIIFAFDPVFPLRRASHPDHIRVGEVVGNIAVRTNTRLYYYATRSPDVLVDVGSVLDMKNNAPRHHKSQLRFHDSMYGPLLALLARLYGRGTIVRHAEGLRKV